MTNSDTLPGPDTVGNYGRWLLPASGGGDPVPLDGQFIGMASSRRDSHNRRIPHPDGFAPPNSRGQCSTCRWTEIRVFRDADGYLIHRSGMTIVPGESPRHPVVRVRTAYEVVESLTSRVAGGAHLTRTPAMALAQCAAYDVPLRDAYENRAVS